MAALVGRDPLTGDWSAGTAGTAWQALGTVALAGVVYVAPGGALLDQAGLIPGFEKGQLGDTLTEVGKAFIAYDQWDDDPARAAGMVTGNVLMAVVGTKGAGAGLSAAGRGAATVAPRVGAGIQNTGAAIARMPTITDLAVRAQGRLPAFGGPRYGPPPVAAAGGGPGPQLAPTVHHGGPPASRGPGVPASAGPDPDHAPTPTAPAATPPGAAPRGSLAETLSRSAATAPDTTARPATGPDTPTRPDPQPPLRAPATPDTPAHPATTPGRLPANPDGGPRIRPGTAPEPVRHVPESPPTRTPAATDRTTPVPTTDRVTPAITDRATPAANDGATEAPPDRTVPAATPDAGRTTAPHATTDDHRTAVTEISNDTDLTPDPGDIPDGHGDTATPERASTTPEPGPAFTDSSDPVPEHLGDQPDGSWTTVDNGERFALTADENTAADRFLAEAGAAEPSITRHIRALTDNLGSARMQGYPDYVLKDPDSFKRKLATALQDDADVPFALSTMKDSIRYTVELPAGRYAGGVVNAVHQLRDSGFDSVTFKPTWADPASYKGVNTTWRDPASGQVFELQFHTPASFAAKMETHGLYKAERVATTDAARESAALAQADVFRRVAIPDDVVARLDDLRAELDGGRPTGPPVEFTRSGSPEVPHGPGGPAGDGPPDVGAALRDDWSGIRRSTELNSELAIHADTATPAQARAFIVENHPYVLEVNLDRIARQVEGSRTNCSRCVPAVDSGFQGAPSSAIPWPGRPDGWGYPNVSRDDYLRSIGADPTAYRAVESYDDVIRDVRDRGESARGMVHVQRARTSHVFNVVNTPDWVVFLDGQTGGLATLERNVDIFYVPIGGEW